MKSLDNEVEENVDSLKRKNKRLYKLYKIFKDDKSEYLLNFL